MMFQKHFKDLLSTLLQPINMYMYLHPFQSYFFKILLTYKTKTVVQIHFDTGFMNEIV